MAYTTRATGIMKQLMMIRILKKVNDVDAAFAMQLDSVEKPTANQCLKHDRFLQDMSVLGQVTSIENQNQITPLLRAMGSDLSASLLNGDITKEQYVLALLSALNVQMQNAQAFADFQEELRALGFSKMKFPSCGMMTSFFTQPKFRSNYPSLPLVRRSDVDKPKRFLKVHFKVIPNATVKNGVGVVLSPRGETLKDALHTLADVIDCLHNDGDEIELRPSWSLVLNMLGQEAVPSNFEYVVQPVDQEGEMVTLRYAALTSVYNVVDDRILALVAKAIETLLGEIGPATPIPSPLKVDFAAKITPPIDIVGRCKESLVMPSDQFLRGGLMLHNLHRALAATASGQLDAIPAGYEDVEFYNSNDLMTNIDRLMRISLGIPALANALASYVYDSERNPNVISERTPSEIIFPLCLRVLIAYALRVNVMVIYSGPTLLEGVVVTKVCDTDVTLCIVVGPFETQNSSKTIYSGTTIENVNTVCLPEWLSNGLCPGMRLKTDKVDSRMKMPLDMVITDDRFQYDCRGPRTLPRITHNAFRAIPLEDLLFDKVPELSECLRDVEKEKRYAMLPRPQQRASNELCPSELEQYASYHRNWLDSTSELVEGPIPLKAQFDNKRENAALPDRVFYCPSNLQAPITGWKRMENDDLFKHMAASMPQRIACSSSLYGRTDKYQLHSRAYYVDADTGLPHACDITIFAMYRNRIIAVICYRVFTEKIWLSALPRGVFVVEEKDEMDLYCRRVEGDLTPYACQVVRGGTDEAMYCFDYSSARGRGIRIFQTLHSLNDRLKLSNGIPLCVRDSMAPRARAVVNPRMSHQDILKASLPSVDCCTLDEEYRVRRSGEDSAYKYVRLSSRIKDDGEVSALPNEDVFVTRAGELGLRYAEGFKSVQDMMRSAIKFRPYLPMHKLFVADSKVFLPCGYVTSIYNPMLHRHKCVRAFLGLKSNDAPSCTNCGLAYESKVTAIICCKKDDHEEAIQCIIRDSMDLE
ncbi:P109 [Thyrinteina arnobia cypovirus 14]|nr:P109 [Thyrinteina arnobia cypovirus 14]